MAPINMPVGYRFLPTDEELIKDYLFNKVFCGTVPAQIIQDITAEVFFNVHPSALAGDAEENEKYFFVHGRELKGSKECNTKTGYWKAKGCKQLIYDSSSSKCIGFKLEFIYFETENCHRRTEWEMVRYRLYDETKQYEAEKICILAKIWNASMRKFYEDNE